MKHSFKWYAAFSALLISASLSASSNLIESSHNTLSLKVPGNPSVCHSLTSKSDPSQKGVYHLIGKEKQLPVQIQQTYTPTDQGTLIHVCITALEDIYFNYGQKINSGFDHQQSQFYMPGFWYRKNLRSPQEAPSFHTSDSWIVREDRLSTPLAGIIDPNGNTITVTRLTTFSCDALTTHSEGEVILSGQTSIGYTGFENINSHANLSFGYPFNEAPKTYIRKLTLIPEVKAFQYLKKGSSIELKWIVRQSKSTDFADFVQTTWEASYDLFNPQPVSSQYTPEQIKKGLSKFFTESYVDKNPLKYMSGVHQHIDHCSNTGIAEVGFVGRVLLNAFNALEYGYQQNRPELIQNSQAIFDSYLQHGITSNGFIKEVVNYDTNKEEEILSIRRQSEGLYATLYYLQYEKKSGRKHSQWEKVVLKMLDSILRLQKQDGSFPRKFKQDMTIVDNSGGSTPAATPMLTLAYKYFNDKRYLECAKKTALYLEKEIISPSDYFSSTLDANCEDKEASYYASSAFYHLAHFTKGKEQTKYKELSKKAAYFALSWYYLWDLPFAQGQMLGDIGLQTRGWGNVSVENNHIDVYIFEFASILEWLSKEYQEARFLKFAKVIETSMRQLMPENGHLCGIAKEGFYPEVIQHTHWDYGRNGKGFYNDIFAPGWTVASLWELFTPHRIDLFLK